MADTSDPLNWKAISRYQQAAGNPDYANWVDPDDPLGWNQAARAASKAGDPNFANWVDPLGNVTPWAAPATTDATAANPAPTTGVTAATAAPGAPVVDRRGFDDTTSILDAMGLSSLYTIDADGNPGGWLWQQVQSGNRSPAGLNAAIEATPVFQQRFPIIATMRAQGSPYVPTPADVRNFEDKVSAGFYRAGLPPSMYTDLPYIQGLMDDYGGSHATSADEILERVGTAYERVKNTNPQIRQAFEEFYGVGGGDQALAAFFLDPTKTMADLDKSSRTAYAGGMGRTLGVDVNRETAGRLADQPKTEAGIMQDLTTVASMGNVLNEGITETQDLTQQTGIEATSFGDAAAQSALERRVLERQANAKSSFGGGLLTSEGLTGVR